MRQNQIYNKEDKTLFEKGVSQTSNGAYSSSYSDALIVSHVHKEIFTDKPYIFGAILSNCI